MPKIFVYKANSEIGETRVALTSQGVSQLLNLGFEVSIPSGAGLKSGVTDLAYEKAGATILKNTQDILEARSNADILLRVDKPCPSESDLDGVKEGVLHLSYFDPFQDKELMKLFQDKGITAVSLEMIPRTTLAQKMDVQSSQTSLAGYAAVLMAASKLPKIFPMMMTPSGTISPARVFIIGVGVAGLQAIATAKRLGARVEAFDTRPAVEEQVHSLGAKFVKIDLGETDEVGGYAKALTEDQLKLQQEAQAKVCMASDVVITTARVFGKKAPVLITEDILSKMKPGAIVVDLATTANSSGNVVGSVAGKEVYTDNGVLILGGDRLERLVPQDASSMFSGNMVAFLSHFTKKEEVRSENNSEVSSVYKFNLDFEDEIAKSCVITHKHKCVHPHFAEERKESK